MQVGQIEPHHEVVSHVIVVRKFLVFFVIGMYANVYDLGCNIAIHYIPLCKCCKMVTSLINCNVSIDDDMLQEKQGSN
jgi:hypothetical protein